MPDQKQDDAEKQRRRVFIDSLGRDRVQRQLGLTPPAITNAISRGLPPGWFPVIEKMCREDGRECPLCLFNWRKDSAA